MGSGDLRLHRLREQPLQRLDRHRLPRVGPAHRRQAGPREPVEVLGQPLRHGRSRLGGQRVAVEVLLHRLAQGLQGVEHGALGDVLLLLGDRLLQGGNRGLVAESAEPLRGLGAHLALAVGECGDDALLLVGDRGQGVLGGPAVGLVPGQRDREEGVADAAGQRRQCRQGAVGAERVDGVVALDAGQLGGHGVEVVGDERRHLGVGPVATEHVAPGAAVGLQDEAATLEAHLVEHGRQLRSVGPPPRECEASSACTARTDRLLSRVGDQPTGLGQQVEEDHGGEQRVAQAPGGGLRELVLH